MDARGKNLIYGILFYVPSKNISLLLDDIMTWLKIGKTSFYFKFHRIWLAPSVLYSWRAREIDSVNLVFANHHNNYKPIIEAETCRIGSKISMIIKNVLNLKKTQVYKNTQVQKEILIFYIILSFKQDRSYFYINLIIL